MFYTITRDVRCTEALTRAGNKTGFWYLQSRMSIQESHGKKNHSVTGNGTVKLNWKLNQRIQRNLSWNRNWMLRAVKQLWDGREGGSCTTKWRSRKKMIVVKEGFQYLVKLSRLYGLDWPIACHFVNPNYTLMRNSPCITFSSTRPSDSSRHLCLLSSMEAGLDWGDACSLNSWQKIAQTLIERPVIDKLPKYSVELLNEHNN